METKNVPVGFLTLDGRLFYPFVEAESTTNVLKCAGWVWIPRMGAWQGTGKPPVPYTQNK